jgi:hypothetical protein
MIAISVWRIWLPTTWGPPVPSSFHGPFSPQNANASKSGPCEQWILTADTDPLGPVYAAYSQTTTHGRPCIEG